MLLVPADPRCDYMRNFLNELLYHAVEMGLKMPLVQIISNDGLEVKWPAMRILLYPCEVQVKESHLYNPYKGSISLYASPDLVYAYAHYLANLVRVHARHCREIDRSPVPAC